MEYFIQVLSTGFNFAPPREIFGNRVYPADSAGSIRDNDPIIYAV
jgi:hypothetical protein